MWVLVDAITSRRMDCTSAGVKFLHANHRYNDIMPGMEVGYAFFINRSVTIEPAIYYDQSIKSSNLLYSRA